LATDGAEAVSRYKEHRPDLLLLDINMPVKNGIDALREIKAEDPAAKVIMLTSVSDRESVMACVQAGALNYIRKDTPLDQMRTMIESSMGIELSSGPMRIERGSGH
jgi:two-component system chemotaxis response regulator CheY